MSDSPAVILYNNLGNPVGVVLEGVVYKLQAQITGAAPDGSQAVGNPVLMAGSDGYYARSIKTTTDGYVYTIDLNAATETTLSSKLSESTFSNRINTLGQKTMSASTPVVIASNQSALPVSIISGDAGGVKKTLYDISNTIIYIGIAAQGTSSNIGAWLIKKTTLDADGNPVSTLYSNDTAVWDDRISTMYS